MRYVDCYMPLALSWADFPFWQRRCGRRASAGVFGNAACGLAVTVRSSAIGKEELCQLNVGCGDWKAEMTSASSECRCDTEDFLFWKYQYQCLGQSATDSVKLFADDPPSKSGNYER